MQEQQKTANLLKLLAALRKGDRKSDDASPLKVKVLIFVNRKAMCGKLVVSLRNHGFLADCIHGDRPQAEREAILSKFRIPLQGTGGKQYLPAGQSAFSAARSARIGQSWRLSPWQDATRPDSVSRIA